MNLNTQGKDFLSLFTPTFGRQSKESEDKNDLHFSRAFRDNRWWPVLSPLWFNF